VTFNIPVDQAPEEVLRSLVEPGDVFKKAGGSPGFFLVVAISKNGMGEMVHAVGYDVTGRPNSTASYGLHYFERNLVRRVGRVSLPDLAVEWGDR
jgi:hypothetical protein